ncbi:MAG: hypothetical protein ACTHKT_12685 [Solirubrobacterales bacterium]
MSEPEVGPGETPPVAPEREITGLSRRVLRRALICIRHFRGELETLRSAYAEREDLPGLRTLVDAMSTLLAETEREIIVLSRRLYQEAQDGNEPRAGARFRGIVGGLIRALENEFPQLLEIAREPHGREIEALIPPYSKLLSELYREEPQSIEVIFEPGDEYAFERSVLERLTEHARSFTPGLRRLLQDFPQLIAIAYPQQRESETLGHAIIAHEIAHTVLNWTRPPAHEAAPIYDAFQDAAVTHSGTLAERIEQLDDEGNLPLEPQAPEDDGEESDWEGEAPAELAMRRLRRWFEELACDALALGMIGPAYIFALADLDLASNRWAQRRSLPGFATHPGLSRRLRHLISLADSTYLQGEERGVAITSLREALHELSADLPEESDEILEEEDALLQAALKNLVESEAVHQVLGPARYLEQDFSVEIELVREKLVAGIPPAERINNRRPEAESPRTVPEVWSRPMQWQSIMNGAYAFWLEGGALSEVPTEQPRILPDRRRVARDWIEFNGYVRGSIELANLQFQLQEARGRLDGLNEPPSN